MGNCLAHCKPISGSCYIFDAMEKHDFEVVRVAKEDGKMLEFSTPIHVKDILTNFPANDIGVSNNATEILSQDYELKGGRLYYLLPHNKETEANSGEIKRIKVLITKQQLQQLVTKQITLQDLLSVVKTVGVHLPTDRKPILDSIPEENSC
ncbi:uncharacterized protein [Cicer arietinum]|uniref:Uncharacterized protein LOC101508248 n=1 Tax=Cicer arietinum TaxID=3827 RepID=A0A1S2YDD4_CICAR|nr:uncharacterized protein LOC101508248 [Cicer arietinum]